MEAVWIKAFELPELPWALMAPRIACYECGRDQMIRFRDSPTTGLVEWYIVEAHRDFCSRKDNTGLQYPLERPPVVRKETKPSSGRVQKGKGSPAGK